jgi:hypothetical protein
MFDACGAKIQLPLEGGQWWGGGLAASTRGAIPQWAGLELRKWSERSFVLVLMALQCRLFGVARRQSIHLNEQITNTAFIDITNEMLVLFRNSRQNPVGVTGPSASSAPWWGGSRGPAWGLLSHPYVTTL